MYHSFCIHSSVDGHLGCSHVLSSINSAATNMGCMCLFQLWFPQGVCPVVGLLGHQFSSVAQLCQTLCDPMDCSTPCFPVLHYLLEFAQTHVFWAHDAFQPSHPLLHPSPPALKIFLNIRVFSNESAHHIRWPKYWSLSFSNSHSNKYSGLISFRIDWFDHPAVQGTLKSLLQHHS